MLKLDHIGAAEAMVLTIDKHVPFTVEVSPQTGDVIYWRAKQNSRSLLELGLARNGKFHSLALVNIDSSSVDASRARDSFVAEAAVLEGVPYFDVSRWKHVSADFSQRFVDEEVQFQLAICENLARLHLGEDRVTSAVQLDRCQFLLADGALVGIEVQRLTTDEIDTLRNACG